MALGIDSSPVTHSSHSRIDTESLTSLRSPQLVTDGFCVVEPQGTLDPGWSATQLPLCRLFLLSQARGGFNGFEKCLFSVCVGLSAQYMCSTGNPGPLMLHWKPRSVKSLMLHWTAIGGAERIFASYNCFFEHIGIRKGLASHQGSCDAVCHGPRACECRLAHAAFQQGGGSGDNGPSGLPGARGCENAIWQGLFKAAAEVVAVIRWAHMCTGRGVKSKRDQKPRLSS